MTVHWLFFQIAFFLNNFFQTTFQGLVFENRSYVSKTTPNIF